MMSTTLDLNTCRRKKLKVTLSLSKMRLYAGKFCFVLIMIVLLTLELMNNAQLLRDSNPIRFIERSRSLSGYNSYTINNYYQ